MATSFIHLHCHSNFSLLDSTLSIQRLVGLARHHEMPAVALTDTNTLSGAVTFYETAVAANIKPIIGAELTLNDESSIVLLVKDAVGYQNLCELITQGKLAGGHGGFQLSSRKVAEHRDGLICLSGGKNSNIYQHLRRRNRRQAFHHALLWKEVFGDDFYMELQSFAHSDDFSSVYLADLARALKITAVATNDVHMAQPTELEIWQVLQAIDRNTIINQLPPVGSREQFFKSATQMGKRFRTSPEVLLATLEIADKCNFQFSLGNPIFPSVDLEPGQTAIQKLRRLCETGLQNRYNPVPEEARQRLERELNTIANLGFVEYFLIVKDIVDFCRREGIPCVGRGSAADSLVSYVLGITRVDPLRYDLYFERFLNPERSDPPDIDLDICWKNRERVLDYVYRKYSHDKTALIATFVTFQLRSSIREIGRAFGLPEQEIGRLTRHLPYRGVAELEKARRELPECRHLDELRTPENTPSGSNYRPQETVLQKILRIANFIADFPRHLSVHPGGTIIAPDKITRYTPLEMAAGGLVISQYDMHSIEKLGLVKMDLLGVRSLSVLADTVEAVHKNHGLTLDLDHVAENDNETIHFIREGRTIGCFQLESPGMRGLLRKMQIENLDDVIAAISLIRPGPSEGGMKDVYIRRRAGLEETTYLHPDLEPILRGTYGIILYQEQVLLVARAIAGFTLGEADILRRAMTKARHSDTLAGLHQKFLAGAARRGISREAAIQIWEWLTHFVGYGFNKAHSATYGLLAYHSAYLKRHFPAEYMLAVLNNDGGYYPRFAYVEEARKLGIPLLSPDVCHSQSLFSLENGALRVGMSFIQGLHQSTVRRILVERKKKPFRDLYDFLDRVNPPQKDAELLCRCGAFRSFHPSEPWVLAQIQIYFKNHRRRHIAEWFTRNLDLPPYSYRQRILYELELLQFAVTAHPLTIFLEANPELDIVPSSDLEKHKNRKVTTVGWVIMSRRIKTQNQGYMKFLTLDDLLGTVEVVLFPRVYDEIGSRIDLSGPLQVTGTIQSRVPGEVNLIAEKVVPLRLSPEKRAFEVRRGVYGLTGS